MELTKGNRTCMKLFTLSLIIIFAAGINAYGKEAGSKSTAVSTAAKMDPNEWKRIVEAAHKEGKIVLAGVPGEGWRKAMVDFFQQDYPGIKVEYTATPGRNMLPRIRQERALGQKLWDLNSGGIGNIVEMHREGFFAPLRPLLSPEILDDRSWIGGLDKLFSDREKKYFVSYLQYLQSSVYVNRDFVKESDLKSSKQLLDPKFRGKIVILNPTGGSSRQSLYHLAYAYGEGFLRDLLSKQDLIITDDNRQQVEWVVRGRYPIAIGFSMTLLIPFEKQGLGKNVVALDDEIIRTTTGSGQICLFEGAPHPNSARVYINWLLSQKTQAKLTKAVEHNSRRLDVPTVETPIDLTKLNKYYSQDTEEGVEFNLRYDPIIKEVLKR